MRNIQKFFSLWATALLMLGLSACGGGEDDPVQIKLPDTISVGQLCVSTSKHVDGDTFTCSTATETFVVRLAAVDAPELSQAYGDQARSALRDLTPAGTQVSCYKQDQYGRRVCRVYSPDLADVQAGMLSRGLAWYSRAFAFEQTSDEISRYTNLMLLAQQSKQGLWSQPNPQAPWDCRSSNACR